MSKPIDSKAPRITLDGTAYMLDIVGMQENGESYYVKYPQRSQPGATEEGEFWAEWTLSSFHGGERVKKILSKDELESFRYDDAESLDQALLAKWGELKLGVGLAEASYVQSTSIPMTVSADGTTVVIGLSVSPYIKTWTSSALADYSTGTISGSGAITDLITAGTTYYAVRGGGLLQCTGAPGTANWTVVAGTVQTTAVGVAYAGSKLFVAKSDGLYNQTDSTSITTEPLSVIAAYRDNIYAGRDRRLYRYDLKAFYLYDELPQGFNMTALIPYRDVLLILGYFKIRTGYKSAVYYLKGSGENHLYSVGDYSADWRMYAACGGDDEIFFANTKRGGADRYDLEVGGITNGPMWGAAGAIPFKAMAVSEGYLYFGRYDNAVGTDGLYRYDIQNPTLFATSGWLTTPEYDFGWSNSVKLFKDIRLECRALATGQGIEIQYSTNGGTSYTSAGTTTYAADGAVTGETYTLNNVSGTTIKLKILLTGPGTSTPTLTKVVVRAARCIEDKDRWKLRLYIADDATKRAALETSYAKRTQLSFTDIDRSTTANVIIEDLAMPLMVDSKGNSLKPLLILREV